MLKGEVQRILERDVDLLSVAQKGQELTQGINDNKKSGDSTWARGREVWRLGASWLDPRLRLHPPPDPESQAPSPCETGIMRWSKGPFPFSCPRPIQQLNYHGTDPGGHH